MRVLLKIQAIQWVLLAITARIAGTVYFRYSLNESSYANILYLSFGITLFALWAVYIIKMKKSISLRCGDKIVRLNTSRFILDTFEEKNIQNALGVNGAKAISVSKILFNFLKKVSRIRHFDLETAKVIQKKETQTNFRYLEWNNRFYLIPDSETQIALVGYNGNIPAEKIEDRIVENNTDEVLHSVKRWPAHVIKENRIQKVIETPKKAAAKTTAPKKKIKVQPINRIKKVLEPAAETKTNSTTKKNNVISKARKSPKKITAKK